LSFGWTEKLADIFSLTPISMNLHHICGRPKKKKQINTQKRAGVSPAFALPIASVVELVIAAKHNEIAKTRTKREQNLDSCVLPNLAN
jgi:hypothetical protein